jgi:hypothetical protein
MPPPIVLIQVINRIRSRNTPRIFDLNHSVLDRITYVTFMTIDTAEALRMRLHREAPEFPKPEPMIKTGRSTQARLLRFPA